MWGEQMGLRVDGWTYGVGCMTGWVGWMGVWVDGWLGDGRLVGGEWACGLLECSGDQRVGE